MPRYDLGRVGFNWRGPYDAEATYTERDCVYHDGASYVCVADAPITNLPPVKDEFGEFWHMLADRGEKGDAGPGGHTVRIRLCSVVPTSADLADDEIAYVYEI